MTELELRAARSGRTALASGSRAMCVREYGRRYRAHHEAKFFRAASTKPHEAKRDFGEWLAEVESRIDPIRKQRKGDGIALMRQQARALAGDWYNWFVEWHPFTDKDHWEQVRDDEALRAAVGEARWEAAENIDDLCREDCAYLCLLL